MSPEEWFWKRRPSLLLTSLPRAFAPSPVRPQVISLIHKAFWDFTDNTGNYALLDTWDHATRRRGHSTSQWGLLHRPPLPLTCTPTSSLYITLPSPPTSLAHLRPDVFTLFPFFIMCRNRTNLATKSFVSRTKCFWCSIHVRSGYSPPPPPHTRSDTLWSVLQKRVDFAEGNQDVHFWELPFCKDLRVYHIWHRKRQMLIKKREYTCNLCDL